MGSINFEILRKDRPALADLGGFAEWYAYTAPAAALVKLRVFGEQLAKSVYQEPRLRPTPGAEFHALLTAPDSKAAAPQAIRDKLQALRREGNKAAHGKTPNTQTALRLIREAHDVGAWYAVRCLGNPRAAMPPFSDVPHPRGRAVNEAGLDRALVQIAERESQLTLALGELEKTRARYEVLEREAAQLQDLARAADILRIDEATTRQRLIDDVLADAGWRVGANGADTGGRSRKSTRSAASPPKRPRATPTMCHGATMASRWP